MLVNLIKRNCNLFCLAKTIQMNHRIVHDDNHSISQTPISDAGHLAQANIERIAKLGIQPKYFSMYPQLCSIKYGDLTRDIQLMRDINLEEEAIVAMLLNNSTILWKCYKTCKIDQNRQKFNRIQYLSQELKISQAELCSKLPKYKFVLSLSITRIMKVVTVLLEHNVEPKDILSDFWILRCKAESVASRLIRVQQAEVDNMKPWMGRCKNLIFESFMTRAASKQKLLGELSLEEYISQRLGCSASEFKEIIDREPQLQKTSVLKIKKILDFLFASGFTASHILMGLPRVANRRIETIHSRLLEVNQEGIAPSIYILCKSKREYQHYINKRKKREPQ